MLVLVLHHLGLCAGHSFNLYRELRMVELRKRKAHSQDPVISPRLKKRNSEKNVAPDSSSVELVPGDIININGFGGDVSIHTGEKTTLKSLLESSQNGVILFTYPKASTPGCK